MSGIDLTPPADDEVEVSVFGPGYGESVLVHLGNQEWMIVDSCVDLASRTPASLNYLRALGVALNTSVKLVIATHWHDDHIRGLATIIESCAEADFVCSAALRPPEFLTLVNLLGKQSMMENSGVDEFSRILQILEDRAKTGHRKKLKWAMVDRTLWEREANRSSAPLPAQVRAFSPSDKALELAFTEFGKLLPRSRTPKRRVTAQRPNHVAVVIGASIGNVNVLLGSDLEEQNDPELGWRAIVESSIRPTEKAFLFKIPHHGSKNGDHPPVWSELLIENPIAFLSPFQKGSVALPTPSDIERIKTNTDHAFLSARLSPKKVKRGAAVEKTIRETVRWIRRVPDTSGQLRCRIKASAAGHGAGIPRIDLAGTATALTTV